MRDETIESIAKITAVAAALIFIGIVRAMPYVLLMIVAKVLFF